MHVHIFTPAHNYSTEQVGQSRLGINPLLTSSVPGVLFLELVVGGPKLYQLQLQVQVQVHGTCVSNK